MKKINTKIGSLFISPVPMIAELNHGFDLIWNLAYETAEYATVEQYFCKKVICSRIDDCDVPWDPDLFKADLDRILACLRSNGKVLVHCVGGHGRTGMALACIKVFIDGYNVEAALKYTWRTCLGPETMAQDDFVRYVCNNLGNRSYEKEAGKTRWPEG